MPSVYPGPEIGLGTGASGNALNPLDPKKEKGLEVNAIYDDKDREYLGYLQNRLMKAKRQKDQLQPELQ